MTTLVFFTVVFAALLHAGWNAVVKSGHDKFLSMTAIVLGHTPLAIVALPFVPFPDPASWKFIIASTLFHFFYQLFLLYSYRIGDLTQVYPIARGTAPLLVTLISVAFLGVVLHQMQIVAVLMIAAGIFSIALVRRSDGLRNPKAAFLAVTTGCFIAGYSLVDGHGARAAGSSLGFYSWLTVLNSIIFAIFIRIAKPSLLREIPRRAGKVFLIGGGASFIAYALVTWAFTQAPIALVTALRETSIIFALVIGVVVLKERLDLAKVLSTMVTICGAGLLRFYR